MLKKYFLYLTLLLSLLSLITVLLLYKDYQKKTDQVSSSVENLLSMESNKLISSLNEVKTDLAYLSQKFQKHAYEHLADDFLLFSVHKAKYDQIRFIDYNGMEKIRVNFDGKTSLLVADDKLQNKKSRYYFLDSIKLQKNNIYISSLDLNIEHGSLEVPIKPMLRFASPVHDNKDQKTGIVILNFLADEVLNRLRDIRSDFFGDFYLLNSDGYYLIGKDSSYEWGFMFQNGDALTFKNHSEDVWKYINSKSTGKYETKSGIYFFRTIDLKKELNGNSEIFCDDSVWKMVVFIPYSHFEDLLFDDFMNNILLYITIVIVLALFLWLLLLNNQRKTENEEEVKKLNKQIENERNIFITGPTIVFKLKNAYGWPVEYVSENVKNILGYDSSEFLDGKLDYANIILPKYIDKFSESIAMAKRNNTVLFEHEPYEVVCNDGKHIWLRDSMLLIRDEHDNVTHLYGYIIDITDLKDAQKKIEESNRYIKTVIDTIADPTVVIDIKTYEVILYNKAAKELYIGKGDMPSSIRCHQLSHANDNPCDGEHDICPISQILLTKEKTRVTHKHFRDDGSIIYVELIAIPIFDEEDNVIQIIESHRDITHHLEVESALKELASTDKLTQTYNRNKFDEILEKSFISAQKDLNYFGLVMFDIDYFKSINDTYGHDVGDRVLIEIAGIVKDLIRKHDILVRWGGEEFIIYIPDSDNKALERISEHLRNAIAKHKFEHVNTPITASFGATMLRADDSVDSLIKRVDDALYSSKNNGRNISTLL